MTQEDYTTELLEETTPPKIMKVPRPIGNRDVDWNQSRFQEEGHDHRLLYAIQTSPVTFSVKYKPGDWLLTERGCRTSNYYYQVIGYGLQVELRYDFPHPVTGIQRQQSTAAYPGRSDVVYYHLAMYRRSDHEELDTIAVEQVLFVDCDWTQFDGPRVFDHITDASPMYIKYYFDNSTKDCHIKLQPPYTRKKEGEDNASPDLL